MAHPRSSIDKETLSINEKDIGHYEGATLVREIDSFRVLGLSDEDADFYTSYPEDKRKKIFRKVDVRLVPMLAAL